MKPNIDHMPCHLFAFEFRPSIGNYDTKFTALADSLCENLS